MKICVHLCPKKIHAKIVDNAVFPGNQGGPHDNVTAAKAVDLKGAFSADFRHYAKNVVENARTLASVLNHEGIKLVTGGTDNHLILINLLPFGAGFGKESCYCAGKRRDSGQLQYGPL